MRVKLFLLLISLTWANSALAGQCNKSAHSQAKMRCMDYDGSRLQSCMITAYEAYNGSNSGYYECQQNIFSDAFGTGSLEGAIRDAQEVPGTEWGTSTNSIKSSPPANNNSPKQFNGVAPFSPNSPNTQNRMPPRSMQNGMLPPSVMQMMQQFQTLGQPYSQPQAANCQGVTTSTITGFDQNGAEAAASKMKSHEILQLVRSQQNNGKKYYLASNGFWYDAGYIKRGSNCSL